MPTNRMTQRNNDRKIAELVTDYLLDQLQKDASIEVDCKIHGKFKHPPIDAIPEGECPDCYFHDEYLKEISSERADWIDKSKLH